MEKLNRKLRNLENFVYKLKKKITTYRKFYSDNTIKLLSRRFELFYKYIFLPLLCDDSTSSMYKRNFQKCYSNLNLIQNQYKAYVRKLNLRQTTHLCPVCSFVSPF